MSRSESSRGVSSSCSSFSTPSGRGPVRSTSLPPCGSIRCVSWTTLTLRPRPGRARAPRAWRRRARRLLGLQLLGVEHELGAHRLLVRVRHAGELLDLALERLLVEALHVAAGALVDRRLDVDLDEGADRLDPVAGLLPRLLVRRDRGRDHGAALARDPRGDPADALDVRVAVLLREAEALREVHADVVAVQVLDDEAAPVELGADEVRDGRLAGAREPGEPEREAARPDVRRLRVLRRVDVVGHVPPSGVSKWMPHSSLSEPAQRPARSSSSGEIGRVHGMHPIERKPTSWSGLYGISLIVM